MTQEREYEFDGETNGPVLELDKSLHAPAPKTARFVSGISTREMAECIYCQAERPLHGPCASCGHDATLSAPPPSRFSSSIVLAPSGQNALTAPSVVEAAIDAINVVPYAVWKRVAMYSFVALVVGNALLCGGLSAHSNLALVALLVFGLAGTAASFGQRNP